MTMHNYVLSFYHKCKDKFVLFMFKNLDFNIFLKIDLIYISALLFLFFLWFSKKNLIFLFSYRFNITFPTLIKKKEKKERKQIENINTIAIFNSFQIKKKKKKLTIATWSWNAGKLIHNRSKNLIFGITISVKGDLIT